MLYVPVLLIQFLTRFIAGFRCVRITACILTSFAPLVITGIRRIRIKRSDILDISVCIRSDVARGRQVVRPLRAAGFE